MLPPIVESDAWCPHTSPMLRGAEVLQQSLIALIQIAQGIVDDLPVHQIFRMENRQPRHTLERRSRHIIILARCPHTDIRIRVIRIDHRVRIRPIAMIRTPHLRTVLGRGRPCQRQAQKGGVKCLFRHLRYFFRSGISSQRASASRPATTVAPWML